jgi:1-acyl-sn-glycerol-3-phosphate acyltransferase
VNGATLRPVVVAALRFAGIVVWSGVCSLMGVLAAFVSSEWPLDVARKLWAPIVLRIAGTRVERRGHPDVEIRPPCVFVANHQSMLDIPVVLSQVPVNLRFVSKQALAWVPLLNLYMWRTRMIFVDRSNPARAYASLDRGAERIRDGVSVVVFAEGTRSQDGRLRPLKRGAFRMALMAGVPIVPLAVEGTRDVLPSGSVRIRPGRVGFAVGEPISSAALPRGDEGIERLRHEAFVRLTALHATLASRA